MKFWKSKAMLLAVLGAMLLVMAVAWLCFYYGGEEKDPDGTLVWQESCSLGKKARENSLWRRENGISGHPDAQEVAA